MLHKANSSLSRFFIAGINYKKTDSSVRGLFAINSDQYQQIASLAPSHKVSEFFILSTCNRTEIYGFADNATQLKQLLCSQTAGSTSDFERLSYSLQGIEAVNHLFEVGAGLESQILGDYEIIGQIKLAAKLAKLYGCMGSFTERLVNSVLQSTKVIKNQTALSGGTVSVSFAAVQYIKKNIANIANKKILLLGTGKIGRNTCKNLVDYLNTKNITLINRSAEKAEALAAELGLYYAPITDLDFHISSSDIILVATNATVPTVTVSQLINGGKKLLIDLSIPNNVEKQAAALPNITLVDVDELSRLKDETLQKRMAEVPKAKAIIETHQAEFLDWMTMRRHAPVLQAVKQKLNDMQHCSMFLTSQYTFANAPLQAPNIHHYAIQKAVKNMAVKMKQYHRPGCSYIEAINEFISTHRN